MPKGYWIARVDVRDPEAYKAYITGAAPAFAEFGGRFLVRGGDYVAAEGVARSRNVVIEFPSFEAAKACYDSAVYQSAKGYRTAVSDGEIVIVQGYDA
jgi:uncharacterized protein (DUF1330 family)